MAFSPNRSINGPRSRTFIRPLFPVVVDTLIVGGASPRERRSGG